MKNRAKCKLCGDIIESKELFDYASCSCGEISVTTGKDGPRCGAKDWYNFLRIDDEGNEFRPKIIDVKSSEPPPETEPTPEPTVDDSLTTNVQALINALKSLPQDAMRVPATHFDLLTVYLILLRIIQAMGIK